MPKLEPPDLKRCQTNRPNTWPEMPSFMTFGPIVYHRCVNKPVWLAVDGAGKMSLCDECRKVCQREFGPRVTYELIPRRRKTK